jgi:hypothetical protein
MRATRRRRRVLLAAAVAVVLLGAGLALVLTGRPGAGHGASPVPVRRSPVPGGAPGTGARQIPSVDLAGLRWGDFHGVELPSSPTAGPRDTSGGLASGFADTPLGALLAALNIGVRANAQWGPAIFGPTIRDQVTGADAAALLASCHSAYGHASQAAHVASGQPLGNAYVTEEAFRWISYSPADATVDLVSAGPGSAGETVRAVTRVEVAWDGGDWRVIAPPGGDWGNSAYQLFSLDGYTTFPGQGDR